MVWAALESVAVVARVVVWIQATVAVKRVLQASLRLFSGRVYFVLLVATVSEASSAFSEQEAASVPKRMRPSVVPLARLDPFVVSFPLGPACCDEQARPSVAL